MLMDPHHSQQHSGLQKAVFQLQQEVTRPNCKALNCSLLPLMQFCSILCKRETIIQLKDAEVQSNLAKFRYFGKFHSSEMFKALANFNCYKRPNVEK